MPSGDTIAAIATAPGRGGIGVIRVSGPQARLVSEVITKHSLVSRQAHYCGFIGANGLQLDKGLAFFYNSPNSYTGEDVLELQGHGGPVVLDMLLQRVLSLGPRLANPGEFTERAFLNDKMDLAQAEAVSDLIESSSEQAARAAMESLQGKFSEKIHILLSQLIDIRIYIESALDFAEEEIDFLQSEELNQRIKRMQTSYCEIRQQAKQGKLLKEGMKVVIAGEPNVGKSSLLNALTGSDNAIVTDIPGTTRDILREYIHLDGMPLHIIDTAGLRESDDPIEQEGIRRAYEQMQQADRILLVQTAGQKIKIPVQLSDLNVPIDRLFNKIDTLHKTASIESENNTTYIYMSAKSGEGIDILRDHLKKCMGFENTTEGQFIARRRHLDALKRSEEHVNEAVNQLKFDGAGELCAEDLRYAQEALNEITGEFTSDDLLGRIFSSFCIGK